MSHSAEKDPLPWRFSGLTVEQSKEVRRLMAQAFEEGVRAMSRALQGGNEPVNPYIFPPDEKSKT